MAVITEAMEHLRISSFLESSDGSKYSKQFQKIKDLSDIDTTSGKADFCNLWSDCLLELDGFDKDLSDFQAQGSTESNWNNFLTALAPTLCDLSGSFRDADWNLHLSSVIDQ